VPELETEPDALTVDVVDADAPALIDAVAEADELLDALTVDDEEELAPDVNDAVPELEMEPDALTVDVVDDSCTGADRRGSRG
jgi:hypothetical protein